MISVEAQKGWNYQADRCSTRSEDGFARLLYGLLDERRVHYRAGLAHERFPGSPPNRLGLLIPSRDKRKWPSVIKSLAACGYLPIRSARCAPKTRRYDFVWFESGRMDAIGVYIAWCNRADRLQEAERAEWTCGSYGGIKRMSDLAGNWYQRLQEWVRPNGLFVVALGPDGAGKSTVIRHLVKATEPVFQGHQLFHWRPALLWRRKHSGNVTDPHAQVPHSTSRSVARIFLHVFDYWFGYLTKIRSALVRSNLVLFDRYFYDLIVDRRRYRYGGPQWVISAVMPLVPKPDLILILDASEETVLSRKQELSIQEVRRQRTCYGELALRIGNAELLQADQEIGEVAGNASRAVMRVLVRRFSERHSVELSGHLHE